MLGVGWIATSGCLLIAKLQSAWVTPHLLELIGEEEHGGI